MVDRVNELPQAAILGPIEGDDKPPEVWELIPLGRERSLTLLHHLP